MANTKRKLKKPKSPKVKKGSRKKNILKKEVFLVEYLDLVKQI